MNNIAENIVNLITKIEKEEVIFIRGKAYLIKPVETDYLKRVIKNNVCKD
jgi:hypothetical protein